MYYIFKIQDIGKKLKYPEKVIVSTIHKYYEKIIKEKKNTAVVFFKRFYLVNSLLIKNPQDYLYVKIKY